MQEAGLSDEQIEINPKCTIEDVENLYSYRRQGKKSGRMMAIIQITEN
jgi:copper oxidase (laccase) domain-containing protein